MSRNTPIFYCDGVIHKKWGFGVIFAMEGQDSTEVLDEEIKVHFLCGRPQLCKKSSLTVISRPFCPGNHVSRLSDPVGLIGRVMKVHNFVTLRYLSSTPKILYNVPSDYVRPAYFTYTWSGIITVAHRTKKWVGIVEDFNNVITILLDCTECNGYSNEIVRFYASQASDIKVIEQTYRKYDNTQIFSLGLKYELLLKQDSATPPKRIRGKVIHVTPGSFKVKWKMSIDPTRYPKPSSNVKPSNLYFLDGFQNAYIFGLDTVLVSPVCKDLYTSPHIPLVFECGLARRPTERHFQLSKRRLRKLLARKIQIKRKDPDDPVLGIFEYNISDLAERTEAKKICSENSEDFSVNRYITKNKKSPDEASKKNHQNKSGGKYEKYKITEERGRVEEEINNSEHRYLYDQTRIVESPRPRYKSIIAGNEINSVEDKKESLDHEKLKSKLSDMNIVGYSAKPSSNEKYIIYSNTSADSGGSTSKLSDDSERQNNSRSSISSPRNEKIKQGEVNLMYNHPENFSVEPLGSSVKNSGMSSIPLNPFSVEFVNPISKEENKGLENHDSKEDNFKDEGDDDDNSEDSGNDDSVDDDDDDDSEDSGNDSDDDDDDDSEDSDNESSEEEEEEESDKEKDNYSSEDMYHDKIVSLYRRKIVCSDIEIDKDLANCLYKKMQSIEVVDPSKGLPNNRKKSKFKFCNHKPQSDCKYSIKSEQFHEGGIQNQSCSVKCDSGANHKSRASVFTDKKSSDKNFKRFPSKTGTFKIFDMDPFYLIRNLAVVEYTNSYLDILWQDGRLESRVSSTEVFLGNIEDTDLEPNDLIYNISGEEIKLGYIHIVSLEDRLATVMWMDSNTMEPNIPLLNIDLAEDRCLRIGGFVTRIPNNENEFFAGMVTEMNMGKVHVLWGDGKSSWIPAEKLVIFDEDESEYSEDLSSEDDQFLNEKSTENGNDNNSNNNNNNSLDVYNNADSNLENHVFNQQVDYLSRLIKKSSSNFVSEPSLLPRPSKIIPRFNPISIKCVQSIPKSHYYYSFSRECSKNLTRTIIHEISNINNNLPEGIHVVIYEDALNMMKVYFKGLKNTPFYLNWFEFDLHLSMQYPASPPQVHFVSRTSQMHPNLHQSGRVCLSLLGTWHGSGVELWEKSKSNILQVLISIQGLLLGVKYPYFLEDGYAAQIRTAHGIRNSILYNQRSFVLCIRSIINLIERLPEEFESELASFYLDNAKSFYDLDKLWKQMTVQLSNSEKSQFTGCNSDINELVSTDNKSILTDNFSVSLSDWALDIKGDIPLGVSISFSSAIQSLLNSLRCLEERYKISEEVAGD